tara:strand:+ start:95 stop:388 length:294 start_codon:yes stop_codon:yes gene_type:complete
VTSKANGRRGFTKSFGQNFQTYYSYLLILFKDYWLLSQIILFAGLMESAQLKLNICFNLVGDGTPGEIRTPDQLVRSQLLYPAELRAHNKSNPSKGL